MKARTLSLTAFTVLALGVYTPLIRNSLAPTAIAQNLGERTVSGTVLGADSAPAPGATVYLKNLKTKSIRSFTAVSGGHFQFAQVNKAEDYDLWAEKDNKKSAVKSVSSWDARSNFVVELKLK